MHPYENDTNADRQLSVRLDVAQEQILSMISQQQLMLKRMYAVQHIFEAERKQITKQLADEFAPEVQTLLLRQGVMFENLVQLNGNLLGLLQNLDRPLEPEASSNDPAEVAPETEEGTVRASCSNKLEENVFKLMDVTKTVTKSEHPPVTMSRAHKKHLHRKYHMAHIVDHYITEIASFGAIFMRLQEPPREGVLAHFVNGPCFNTACTLAILVNAAVVAVFAELDVEAAVATGLPQRHPGRVFIEAAFVVFYAVEVALKLHVHKLYYFVGSDMGWNIFDIFLIFMGIGDFASDQLNLSEGSVNPTFMRMIRMCKLVRILRSIRVLKFFHELRVMLLALLASTMSLTWSMAMLAFILYMFGLVFIQGVTSKIFDSLHGQYKQLNIDVSKQFGTLDRAMLTLYQAVTGGQDWAPIYEVTQQIGHFYSWLFLFFTIFFMFAVVNIVTAIYVDSVQKHCTPDHQEILDDWRRTHKIRKQTIAHLIEELDSDHSGKINQHEFEAFANSDAMIALLENLGIHVGDAETLFHLMTSFADSVDHEVDRDMFLNALLRITGKSSSAIDLHLLSCQLKLVHQGQSNLREQVRQIQSSLGKTHVYTVGMSPTR